MTEIKIQVPFVIDNNGAIAEVMEYYNNDLEYVPLYALNQFRKFDAEFSAIKPFEERELDELTAPNKKIVTKMNAKYKGQQLSYYKFYLLAILSNGLSDGLSIAEIKKQMTDFQEQCFKVMMSVKNINGNISEGFNRSGDFWNTFAEMFEKGMRTFNKLTFASENFIVNYGYIGLANEDFTKQDCLISYMVKKEHIPLIKANWMMGIPIPEGVIEAWMTVPMDATGYIRGKFKEHITPVIEAHGIKIVHKTIEELALMWKRVPEPIFKTIPERKQWMDGIIQGFITSEKEALGIKEKPKFNFASVKTKIA